MIARQVFERMAPHQRLAYVDGLRNVLDVLLRSCTDIKADLTHWSDDLSKFASLHAAQHGQITDEGSLQLAQLADHLGSELSTCLEDASA